MNKNILKVAKFEIVRQLKKPAFWAATLLIPLLIGFIYFISFISAQSVDTEVHFDENTKIAITDDAGILDSNVPYIINGDKEYGIEMVKNGEVDLYFYIPADFAESKKAEFYHISEGLEIFNTDGNIIKVILSQNSASRVDELDVIALSGDYEVVDKKITKDGADSNALGKAIIPFFIGIVFFMFIALCGNRFLLTVVEEKENRISEMILTSISSKHLIVGKIIALLILGLVQIAALVIPILLLIFAKRNDGFIAPILAMIEIDPVSITLSILLFSASAVLYAGVCVLVGSLVSTARDASSFIGPAIICMVFPLYFMQMFMVEPNLIVQIFTYFPLSAPVALMLRNGFGTITTLEFCIGIAVVTVSAVIAIRLAVKTFQKNAINFSVALPKFLQKKKSR
ncbi:ABC transporter permease [Candidatus Saccharibacteria bacterium]|nr:ABC transporter permease [Candidatus Saccharibacteria bacterium]